MPGLEAKLWLSDPDSNTYGGVYVWADAEAETAFAASDLFATVAAHPNLAHVTSRGFDVLPGPTAVTRGDRSRAHAGSVTTVAAPWAATARSGTSPRFS